MSKILVSETIYKDGECPICFDCRKPAVSIQIQCNCGCNEIWCQPCFYKHYHGFAIKMTLQRFTGGKEGSNKSLAEILYK